MAKQKIILEFEVENPTELDKFDLCEIKTALYRTFDFHKKDTKKLLEDEYGYPEANITFNDVNEFDKK